MTIIKYLSLKSFWFIFCIFLFSFQTCFGQLNFSADKNLKIYSGDFNYQIGPGDTIQIKVWLHPDLNMTVIVRPDCRISFPLVDEIDVRNITPETLKRELEQKLGRTIRDPQVTVNVVGFESKKIFVLGEVRQPGVYPFEGQEHVLDAIIKAGGYNDTAALKSIVIIKNGYTSKQRIRRVNILKFIQKGDLQENILIASNDIVFVPKTFIANLDKFIEQFFSKTDPVLHYYLEIYNIKKPGVLSVE